VFAVREELWIALPIGAAVQLGALAVMWRLARRPAAGGETTGDLRYP
jgi:hypothetical protein